MHNRRKRTKGQGFTAVTIIRGSIISLLVSMFLIAAVSAMILGGVLDAASMTMLVYAILFLSVFLGTLTNAYNTETQFAISTAAISAVYLFILITINIIFYNGTFDRLMISLGITVAAAILPTLLSAYGRKGKKRRYARPY